MQEEFTHKKKVKLANKISKIKKETDYIKIYKIIGEDVNAGNNVQDSSGIHMFFHKLSTETYLRVEEELKKIKHKYNIVDSTSSETYSDKKEYKSYTEDEFPSQKDISPKLKYSNKEKSLIKRRRYEKSMNDDHDNDSEVVYTSFDVNVSESETKEKSTVKTTKDSNTTSV
jgi:transketolase